MGNNCCSSGGKEYAKPQLQRAIKINEISIKLLSGDITELTTDVIINSANARL
jgi:hypothetical protein